MDIPPFPEGATLLGELDGIAYVQMPGGEVWTASPASWRIFLSARAWPYSLPAARLTVQQQAERIAELERHQQRLVAALRDLVTADNCGYERDTMRAEGYFDAGRTALIEATGEDLNQEKDNEA